MTARLYRIAAPCALALLASCGPRPDDRHALARGEVLLQVAATGTAEARPDEARFSVGMSTIDASASAATDANTRKLDAILARLKALGIADQDIQTQQLTIQRIDYGVNRGRYQADNVIAVRVRAVGKAGAAVAAATGAGANVLSGPDLRVGDPNAGARLASIAAFRAARARADGYAEAAGLKVARIVAIREGTANGFLPEQMMEDRMIAPRTMAAAPPPAVMAGTNTSTATVSVDFALGPK